MELLQHKFLRDSMSCIYLLAYCCVAYIRKKENFW